MPKALEVEQYDSSSLRFLVRSENDPEEQYLVDLDSWTCECQHFKKRLYPQQVKNWDNKRQYCCKHLTRSKEVFTNTWIDAIVEMVQNKAENE